MNVMGFVHFIGSNTASTALRLAGAGVALTLLTGGSMQSCIPNPDTTRSQLQGRGWSWQGRMKPTDQNFLTMMVLHHEDAIAMADLALVRARRDEIKNLARTIKVNQGRENEQMRRWYRQWYGSDLVRWAPDRRMGMDWQHSRMMGVNIQALRQSIDFDRAFIEQMIPHHQMGVMMSTMTGTNTRRHEIRKLAEEISSEQTKEIKIMDSWYREWYP
jgi:uncharacterized protein (DUF305 family)